MPIACPGSCQHSDPGNLFKRAAVYARVLSDIKRMQMEAERLNLSQQRVKQRAGQTLAAIRREALAHNT